jgi:murein DD-endopeptidase MepM/ murein hydrolase activator NlpD
MKREVEVIITPLYKTKTYHRRFTIWQLRIIIAGFVLFVILAGLGLYLLHYTNQQNMAIRYLYTRNLDLETEAKKITELQNKLRVLEVEREKIAKMLGVDKNPPPIDLATLEQTYQPVPEAEKTAGTRFQVAPTTGYIISRGYGKSHTGLDFAAQLGMPIFSVANGKIEDVGFDTFYGYYIKINHDDGYVSFYGHLYKTIKAKSEQVLAGDIIGYVGSSGKSSAPHLHFELWQIKDGKTVVLDPEKELKHLLKPRSN